MPYITLTSISVHIRRVWLRLVCPSSVVSSWSAIRWRSTVWFTLFFQASNVLNWTIFGFCPLSSGDRARGVVRRQTHSMREEESPCAGGTEAETKSTETSIMRFIFALINIRLIGGIASCSIEKVKVFACSHRMMPDKQRRKKGRRKTSDKCRWTNPIHCLNKLKIGRRRRRRRQHEQERTIPFGLKLLMTQKKKIVGFRIQNGLFIHDSRSLRVTAKINGKMETMFCHIFESGFHSFHLHFFRFRVFISFTPERNKKLSSSSTFLFSLVLLRSDVSV